MIDTLLKGNILIVITDLSLGRWCVDRLRQLVGFFQTFRKLDAAYSTVLLVACPAASCDVSTYDTLDRQHVQFTAHHGFSFEFLLLEKLRHILGIYRDHVVRKNVLSHVKPEFGHLGQYSTFLCNFIIQNYVKAADTVCCNHDQTVAIVIDLTYFTFFDWF